jgi:hypothetical protein
MTGILEKLGMGSGSRNVRQDLHLEFIRFQKFLENMRAVLRFTEDAKDKLTEEYVFDRHYILSLVDGVLEEATLLAFNASVLTPAAGSRIYLRLDEQKEFAQNEFLKPDSLRMDSFAAPPSGLDADPETLWLHAVLNWIAGPLPQNRPSLSDFIRHVVDEVMEHCRKEALIQKAGRSARRVQLSGHGSLKVVDFGKTAAPAEEPVTSAEHINCRPFGLLVLGLLDTAASGIADSKKSGTGRWMLFDEDELSLRVKKEHTVIHLEAALYGNVISDFIFLYSRDPFDLKSICPGDAWVEKTERGTLAWIYDAPAEYLEKQLIQLGSELLRRSECGSAHE